MTLQERFWEKVNKTDSCWHWTAYRHRGGYGQFKLAGRHVYAHRFAYESEIGPIPDGLQLDHLCRVRHCVNPAHMEPVTCRVNTLRGDTLAAKHAAKTHCPLGHALEGDNLVAIVDNSVAGLVASSGRTYELRRGQRSCRICKNARHRTPEYLAKQRARWSRQQTARILESSPVCA